MNESAINNTCICGHSKVHHKYLKREMREPCQIDWCKCQDFELIYIALAKKMHKFYLETIKHLSPKNYNPKAAKSWDELTEEQQKIDIGIAVFLLEEFEVKPRREGHVVTYIKKKY